MRIGLYYCDCGMDDMGPIPGQLDVDELERRLVGSRDIAYFKRFQFVCSEEGCAAMRQHLEEHRPDRVVVTSCSVRDQEGTFRDVLQKAGINPYYLQLVNVREQVAWVTDNSQDATEKAYRYLLAAAHRVQLHEPLEAGTLDLCCDVLIIGGGPAGLKAALTLAEAGRRVTVVESSPILGGLPVRIEDLFPQMDCGACLLEPVLNQVLHSKLTERIELMLSSEVTGVSGYFGNFLVQVARRPRFVDINRCIGCGMCIESCPGSMPSRINLGRAQRKAIDVEFLGGLPYVPYLEPEACQHFHPLPGEQPCTACQDLCPVENTIRYDDSRKSEERRVGAIIVAVGGALYDCSGLVNLGYGRLPEVYTSFELERLLAANGPTEGRLERKDGRPVEEVAILHCVGSLDPQHRPYCSGICCLTAFKLNQRIGQKIEQAQVTHFYKTIVVSGKDSYASYSRCRSHSNTRLIAYQDLQDLLVEESEDGRYRICWRAEDGASRESTADIVVLMPALIPQPATTGLAELMDLNIDSEGFFEELHGRTESSCSGVRGIYLAGTCRGPMDLQQAMTEGLAAAGQALSVLVPDRTLTVSPVVAQVESARCSGCWTCLPVCPYKAIGFADDEGRRVSRINPVLCTGCGTCVAACPSGAILGHHFRNEEIFAEIEELLV